MRQRGKEKLKCCLMGRVKVNKQVNKETFMNVIPKIWRTNREVEIVPMNRNTFVFYFDNLIDKRRVWAGGTWHFDSAILVLEEPSEFGEVGKMKFNKTEFWIQIHNVPLSYMVKETCFFLGEQIGRVVELDKEESRRDGQYIRMRVEIDVEKPLKRVLKVDLSCNGEILLLVIKYERLPAFCFRYGILGHSERGCTSHTGMIALSPKPYGLWLRANSLMQKQGTKAKTQVSRGRETEENDVRKVVEEIMGLKTDQRMTPITSNKAGTFIIEKEDTKNGKGKGAINLEMEGSDVGENFEKANFLAMNIGTNRKEPNQEKIQIVGKEVEKDKESIEKNDCSKQLMAINQRF